MPSWRTEGPSGEIVVLLVLSLFLLPPAVAQRHRLATAAEYHEYVDPLVAEPDFGIHYFDDGAADASVLYPNRKGNPYARPSEPVLAIMRAGAKSIPSLIDCLTDGRTTSVYFDGNNITSKMKVPVGYVCLDILMATPSGPGIEAKEDADGLGGGMNTDFYFRPDDYTNCWPNLRECDIRPWVAVVQKNWTRKFLEGQLRFRNPYDDWHIPAYFPYTTEGLKQDRSKNQPH